MGTRPRAIFYLDDFNLYNGLARRAKSKRLDAIEHRWLNLPKLGQFLMQDAHVVLTRYFTSRVKRRVDDPDAFVRQDVFLRALATLPNLSIRYGHFQKNAVVRRRADNVTKAVKVIDVKEKGSDVNLAAYLVHDALKRECEIACVVSSDSDLVEPTRLAREALPNGVIVFNPNAGQTLKTLAAVDDGRGKTITKPTA